VLLGKSVTRNPATNGWRATVRITVNDKEEECEIACRLLLKGRPISEKWNHLWKK
jgi:glucan biosynthesis protein